MREVKERKEHERRIIINRRETSYFKSFCTLVFSQSVRDSRNRTHLSTKYATKKLLYLFRSFLLNRGRSRDVPISRKHASRFRIMNKRFHSADNPESANNLADYHTSMRGYDHRARARSITIAFVLRTCDYASNDPRQDRRLCRDVSTFGGRTTGTRWMPGPSTLVMPCVTPGTSSTRHASVSHAANLIPGSTLQENCTRSPLRHFEWVRF